MQGWKTGESHKRSSFLAVQKAIVLAHLPSWTLDLSPSLSLSWDFSLFFPLPFLGDLCPHSSLLASHTRTFLRNRNGHFGPTMERRILVGLQVRNREQKRAQLLLVAFLDPLLTLRPPLFFFASLSFSPGAMPRLPCAGDVPTCGGPVPGGAAGD